MYQIADADKSRSFAHCGYTETLADVPESGRCTFKVAAVCVEGMWIVRGKESCFQHDHGEGETLSRDEAIGNDQAPVEATPLPSPAISPNIISPDPRSSTPNLDTLLARGDGIFIEQRQNGDPSLQAPSLSAVQTYLASIANESTRQTKTYRWNAFVKYCESKSTPIFPICGSLLARYMHETGKNNPLLLASVIEGCRTATEHLWKGRPGFSDFKLRYTVELVELEKLREAPETTSAKRTAKVQRSDQSWQPIKEVVDSSSSDSDGDSARPLKRVCRRPTAPNPVAPPHSASPRRTFTLPPINHNISSNPDVLSIPELQKILSSLSSILGTPSLASSLYQIGVDSITRLINLAHGEEDQLLVQETFGELERRGVNHLQRRMLWAKLGELRRDLAAAE
ncbi:hypothetical protein RQP46_009313 [Phenoliferia psychrophenolica]